MAFTEAENTLRSMGVVKALHLVSAGRIGGPVWRKQSASRDVLGSVYLDNVAAKYWNNTEVKYNVGDNVNASFVDGSASQAQIPGFGLVGNAVDVGTTIPLATPITRSNLATSNYCDLTIGFPEGLFDQRSNGIFAATVNFQLQRRNGSSGVWEVIHTITLTDKSTSYTELTYRLAQPVASSAWQVRAIRITADSTATTYKNTISLARHTQLVQTTQTYNNFAVYGIVADGKSLPQSSVPTITFEVDGIFLQVPANYTAGYFDANDAWVNPVYTGGWDGFTFRATISSNPVWILYYLLTNTANGLGDTIKSSDIDVYSFYAAAQYCDQLVSITEDGVSKSYPRFRFDWQFTERDDAYTMLQAVASSFNARVVHADGKISLMVDNQGTASRLVNASSVKEGRFIWSSAPKSNRTTHVALTWYDRNNNYQPDVIDLDTDEYFSGSTYIDDYGYNTQDLIAVGCVTKDQAIRQARYTLDTAISCVDFVEFEMPHQGMDLDIGQIVDVDDPVYTGLGVNGRIKAIGANYIDLDTTISITSGATIKINNTGGNTGFRADLVVSATATNASRIFVSSSLTGVQVGDEWSSTVTIVKMRVVGISEGDSPTDLKITCRKYDNSLYARVDSGISIVSIDPFKAPEGIAEKPGNITFKENLINIDGVIQRNLLASWGGGQDFVSEWIITWSTNGGDKQSETTNQPSIELRALPVGYVEFEVRAKGMSGLISDGAYAKYTWTSTEALGGVLLAPTNISVNGAGGTTWAIPDLIVTWDNPSTNSNYVIKDSKVVIKNGTTVLRTVYVSFIPGQQSRYVYTFDQNISDGGPRRALNVDIQFRDAANRLSAVG